MTTCYCSAALDREDNPTGPGRWRDLDGWTCPATPDRLHRPQPVAPNSRQPGFDGRALRDILCRACPQWMSVDPATGLWVHHDGTPACVQPEALYAEADARTAARLQPPT